MNLGGLEATRQQGHAARVAEENQEQGDEVVLNFSLPDGSSKRLGYKVWCTWDSQAVCVDRAATRLAAQCPRRP